MVVLGCRGETGGCRSVREGWGGTPNDGWDLNRARWEKAETGPDTGANILCHAFAFSEYVCSALFGTAALCIGNYSLFQKLGCKAGNYASVVFHYFLALTIVKHCMHCVIIVH